jgi:transaldolase
VLDELIAAHRHASEDDIAWRLIGHVVKEGAALLAPTYAASQGTRGFLCAQVSPKFWRDTGNMVAHGLELAALADNVAIKAPCTTHGIAAMEELTARGVSVNATVSFSVSQAVAVAEAIERGLARAPKTKPVRPVVTLMIGRIDDHVRRVVDKDKLLLDPGHLHWAGIAVFKHAWAVFRRRGFTATLLAAAYRHHLHWTTLIGPGVVQTIPYSWWRQFDSSGHALARTLEEPVNDDVLATLRQVPDFVRAYDEGGLEAGGFARYGATVHTLRQFLEGYDKLLALVRERMLP